MDSYFTLNDLKEIQAEFKRLEWEELEKAFLTESIVDSSPFISYQNRKNQNTLFHSLAVMDSSH